MDKIQATPSSPLFQAFIDALKYGKQKLADLPILGEKGSFLREKGPEFLIPEAGLGVLQNAAEGHMPWRVPEMSRIPQIRQNVGHTRGVGDIVDAVGMLPVGAALKGVSPAAQAMLYAGALRKDLFASHNVKVNKLLREGQLPRELYHPSFAVTKNKLSAFADGPKPNVVLIPRHGKLDPKTDNTALFAIDAWTPRHNKAAGDRIDELTDRVANNTIIPVDDPAFDAHFAALMQQALREQANARLADKFLPTFPKGGMFGEEASRSTNYQLPRYGKKGLKFTVQNSEPALFDSLTELSSIRFPSFKAYETSPYGAKRLDGGPNYLDLYDEISKFVQYYGVPYETAKATLIRLAQLKNATAGNQAREYIDRLRHTKSYYGELKKYGPMQLNEENFAGAILRGQGSEVNNLQRQLERRNIPTDNVDGILGSTSRGELESIISDMFQR